jgi:hypothetical protein
MAIKKASSKRDSILRDNKSRKKKKKTHSFDLHRKQE